MLALRTKLLGCGVLLCGLNHRAGLGCFAREVIGLCHVGHCGNRIPDGFDGRKRQPGKLRQVPSQHVCRPPCLGKMQAHTSG